MIPTAARSRTDRTHRSGPDAGYVSPRRRWPGGNVLIPASVPDGAGNVGVARGIELGELAVGGKPSSIMDTRGAPPR
jgi:hypothetical protein